jgi:3-hydroxybutyryl-CoA dehydrogenase
MPATNEIAAVGVIGAGQMGSGIAQLAAAAGCAVLLLDSDPTALSRAVASISASLRRLAAKGQLSQVRAP